MSLADTPFEFETLLTAWEGEADLTECYPRWRAFLETKAKMVIDHLADHQLTWAVAAWQRQGELFFAQRFIGKAEEVYRELYELLAEDQPVIGYWLIGALAECRVQRGEVEDGIADLADLLMILEEEHLPAAVEAMTLAISEAVPLLELPPEKRPTALEPPPEWKPPPVDQTIFPKSPFEP
ncbi:MAG: hypothetical protein ABI743_01335 [bacterium]